MTDDAPGSRRPSPSSAPRPAPVATVPPPEPRETSEPAARPRPRPSAPAATPERPTRPRPTSGPDLTKFLAASEPQPGDDKPDREPRKERQWPGKVRAALAATPGAIRRRLSGNVRILVRYVIIFGIVAITTLLLRAFVVSPYYIPSASMEPTLHGCPNCNDDHVLVDKISYRLHDPRRKDVVVFDRPPNFQGSEEVLIKRVIATASQTVKLKGGQVYVDGLRISEPYLNPACGPNPTKALTGKSSWKVPDGSIFVMGDNRCQSADGRVFGPIKVSSVIGRAWLKFWPLKRFGTVGG